GLVPVPRNSRMRGWRVSRRSGYRFADKDTRNIACPGEVGTGSPIRTRAILRDRNHGVLAFIAPAKAKRSKGRRDLPPPLSHGGWTPFPSAGRSPEASPARRFAARAGAYYLARIARALMWCA